MEQGKEKVEGAQVDPSPDGLGGASRLLPCPFCGGDAAPDALMIGEAGKDNATPHGHCVECQTCLAMSGMMDTPEEAAEKWNQRAKAGLPPESPKETPEAKPKGEPYSELADAAKSLLYWSINDFPEWAQKDLKRLSDALGKVEAHRG